MLNPSEYIEINSEIRFGKPYIKGTRITVSDVLQWLASDMSIEEILEDFPQLKRNDILACLAYSAMGEDRTRVLLFS